MNTLTSWLIREVIVYAAIGGVAFVLGGAITSVVDGIRFRIQERKDV